MSQYLNLSMFNIYLTLIVNISKFSLLIKDFET